MYYNDWNICYRCYFVNASKFFSGVVSPSAASLYANLAADILEGETLDEPVSSQTKNSKVQETQKPRISEQHPPPNIQPAPPAVAPHNIHANRQQILLVGGQQYMVAQPHPALVQVILNTIINTNNLVFVLLHTSQIVSPLIKKKKKNAFT